MPKRFSATVFKFSNGLVLKGSYKLHIGGLYLDLYAINKDGQTLVSRSVKLTGNKLEAAQSLIEGLEAMAKTIKAYRIDIIDDDVILAVVIKSAFDHTFPKAA